MENEKEKNMTLDDLARIVQNGFLRIENRLDNMDERLHTVEETTTEIRANLNKKVDKIEYNTLEYRVERLEDARAA